MLTRDEALLAAKVAEKYPAGLSQSSWGRSRAFRDLPLLGDPWKVARYIAEHPRAAAYG